MYLEPLVNNVIQKSLKVIFVNFIFVEKLVSEMSILICTWYSIDLWSVYMKLFVTYSYRQLSN